MKVKCTPEDFVVTECSAREPTSGAYSLYRLEKRSIGTLEALGIIQRSRNLTRKQISHGGLKDRHACTSQYITIRKGASSDLEHDRFRLTWLGHTDSAFTASDISANHFRIVLRSLSVEQQTRVLRRAELIRSAGFPNYFDSQRFGSVGASRDFVAAHWCRRDYERALWLALAEHNSHDDAAERAQKRVLRDHWKDWITCKAELDRSHRRSIVTYLVDHPEGFRKAFALLNADMRGLYLSAFQSAVWNRMLTHSVRERQFEVFVGDCNVAFPAEDCTPSIPAELPLPSARCRGLSPEMTDLCNLALQTYELELTQMKLSFPRDRWFSRGQRATTIAVPDLQVSTTVDDLYQGRQQAVLDFRLPRGCYATMLIKMLTENGPTQDSVSDGESGR